MEAKRRPPLRAFALKSAARRPENTTQRNSGSSTTTFCVRTITTASRALPETRARSTHLAARILRAGETFASFGGAAPARSPGMAPKKDKKPDKATAAAKTKAAVRGSAGKAFWRRERAPMPAATHHALPLSTPRAVGQDVRPEEQEQVGQGPEVSVSVGVRVVGGAHADERADERAAGHQHKTQR